MPYRLEPESSTAVLEPPTDRYRLEPPDSRYRLEPVAPEPSFIPFGAGPPPGQPDREGPPGAISRMVTGGLRFLGRKARSVLEAVSPPTEAFRTLADLSREDLARLSREVGAVTETGEPLITPENVQEFPQELENAMLVLSFIPMVPGPPAGPPAEIGTRAGQIAATRQAIKRTAEEIRAREFQRGVRLLEPPGGLPKPLVRPQPSVPKPSVPAPVVSQAPAGLPKVSRGLHVPTLLPDELAAVQQIRQDVAQGVAGTRMPIEGEVRGQGATRQWIGVPSTFPEYFQNKGYTKARVLRIVDRVQAGQPITEKQRAVLDDLVAGFQAHEAKTPRGGSSVSPEIARYRLEEVGGLPPERFALTPEAPTPPVVVPIQEEMPGMPRPSTPTGPLVARSPEGLTPLEAATVETADRARQVPLLPVPSGPVEPELVPGAWEQLYGKEEAKELKAQFDYFSQHGKWPGAELLEPETIDVSPSVGQKVLLPQFEKIGGDVTEVGGGLPLTRQSFLQWQVASARAKVKAAPLQAQADQLAPKVTIVTPARDMGWLSMFGTPSNRLKRYGPLAEQAITDLNLTEMRQIRAIGQRNEADYLQGIAKIPAKEIGTFVEQVFEGRPIETILARTDISQGTKEAAQYFRAKFDVDRGSIVLLQREWLRSAMESKVTAQLRAEGFAKAGARRTKAEMATFRAEAATRTKAELAKAVPDTWGIKEYFPHLFPGEFRVLVRNAKGELDFIGEGRSQWEAQAVIAKHFAENPKTTPSAYQIETRMFMDPDLVRVSTPRRWKLLHDLAEAMQTTPEEVADATKGIIGTRERKQKWWGSLRHRAGAPGYSKDLQWVLQVYNAGLVRWATITELNRRLQPILRTMRNAGQTQLAAEVEANFKILSGYKSPTSDLLDNTLAQTPGVRIIAQPFALERWTSRLKGWTATGFLKLSVRFHLLNRFQIFSTLWPVVDTAELVEGIRLSQTAEGRAILNQYAVRFLAARGKIAEHGGGLRVLSARRLERLNLLAPETSNQEIAFLTMYQKGVEMGMAPSKAADYAFLRGNLYTQFVALRTDQPRAFYRGIRTGLSAPIKSTAFQFQRFNIKNLEIGFDLLASKNVSGATKWLGMMFLLGGARAFLVGGTGYLSYKTYQAIKEKYGETMAQVIAYGLPSLLGMDLSYSIQVVNPPYGQSIAERVGRVALGPLGNLAVGVGAAAMDTKGVEPDARLRAIRAVVQRVPSLRWMEGVEKVWTGRYDFRDPGGRLRFHGDLKDVLMQIGAFRSLRQAEQDLMLNALADIKIQRDAVLDEAAAVALHRVPSGQAPTSEDVTQAKAAVDQWNAMFPEFPITEQDLTARMVARGKAIAIPQATRRVLSAPKVFRPTFLPSRPPAGVAP